MGTAALPFGFLIMIVGICAPPSIPKLFCLTNHFLIFCVIQQKIQLKHNLFLSENQAMSAFRFYFHHIIQTTQIKFHFFVSFINIPLSQSAPLLHGTKQPNLWQTVQFMQFGLCHVSFPLLICLFVPNMYCITSLFAVKKFFHLDTLKKKAYTNQNHFSGESFYDSFVCSLLSVL